MKNLKRIAAFILLAAVICTVWYVIFTAQRLGKAAEYRNAVTAVKERGEYEEYEQIV